MATPNLTLLRAAERSNAEISAKQVAAFATAQHDVGYMSADCKRITTWTGETLATVTRLRVAKVGSFGGRVDRYYFRAVAADGARWYGSGPGPGMFARLHRAKGA